MESLHLQMLKDDIPEKERLTMDPDYWHELNLTNAYLFPNLNHDKMKGMEQLVPGRLFTTRLPTDLNHPDQIILRANNYEKAKSFMGKIKKNDLRVVLCLTDAKQFEILGKLEYLTQFYKQDCGLIVFNIVIEESNTSEENDLVQGIIELTHHLAMGHNCLVQCIDGNGISGMVAAAILQNFGVDDAISRVRKVKSTYVNTIYQEKLLEGLPKILDKTSTNKMPRLACAVAAEKLIQINRKHKNQVGEDNSGTDELPNIEDLDLGDKFVEKWEEEYGQIFDILSHNISGKVDKERFDDLIGMVGSEINTDELTATIKEKGYELGDDLTRNKFIELMCKATK